MVMRPRSSEQDRTRANTIHAYRQADFAAIGRVELASQSRYETAKQRPKVEYLLAITSVGADAQYILTGRRSGGDALDAQEAAVIDNFRAAAAPTRSAVAYLLKAVVEGTQPEGAMPGLPSEDALARMFQGMLLPLGLDLDLEGVSRELARRLPGSLEVAGGAGPAVDLDDGSDRVAAPPVRAKGRRASGQEPRT